MLLIERMMSHCALLNAARNAGTKCPRVGRPADNTLPQGCDQDARVKLESSMINTRNGLSVGLCPQTMVNRNL